MNRLLAVSTGLALALTAVTCFAQETCAPTVQYHSQDIVPIHAKLISSKPACSSFRHSISATSDDSRVA